jgi:UDP-N-acetyl-D-glucosamine dehydrogenase
MPYFCVSKITRALNSHAKPLQDSKILILGVAYKADIDDLRESPALRIIRQLDDLGAVVDYHDPFVPELPELGRHSIDFHKGAGISAYDAVVIVTAHTTIDYTEVVEKSQLVVDFRNATADVCDVSGKVWKL